MKSKETQPPSSDTILRALRVSSFDYTDMVWWRETANETGTPDLRIFVNCNDLFFWGSADLEAITDDNIALLENTVAEVEAITGKWQGEDGFLLWCARNRKMRPQGAFYKYFDVRLLALFDACGPERKTGAGNPEVQIADDLKV